MLSKDSFMKRLGFVGVLLLREWVNVCNTSSFDLKRVQIYLNFATKLPVFDELKYNGIRPTVHSI